MRFGHIWFVVLATNILLIGGCNRSDGPRLAPVKGVILLDGQPLANARIVFQPVGKQASPSFAETSDKGEFNLAFTRDRSGAMIGIHQIQITTARLTTDSNGTETVVAEKIPLRYNSNSQLKLEVKSGQNEFEIKLDSRGPIQQPGAPIIPISC